MLHSCIIKAMQLNPEKKDTMYRVVQKTGLFLKVDNFAMVNWRKAYEFTFKYSSPRLHVKFCRI